MATMYAWSRILYGADVHEKTGAIGKLKFVEVGDEVTASKLGLDKDQFQELVDAGSVREEKFPVPEGDSRSPIEYLRAKAREMEEGAAFLGTRGATGAAPEESALADAMKAEGKGGSS